MIFFDLRDLSLLLFNKLVNKNNFGILKYIFTFIFFCLLTLFMGKKCYSAEDCDFQNAKPDVLITIIFIEETKACTLNGKPSGYCNKKDNPDKKRCCDKLEYNQLKYLQEEGITVIDQKPIDTLNLQGLFKRIELYMEICNWKAPCTEPKDRFSIVLVFDFKMNETKGVPVTLQREIPQDMKGYFKAPDYGNYSAEGELDEGGHWINHQRADLFLPGDGVEWILKSDKYCWKFITDK